MKANTFLAIAAIVTFLYALAFMLIPQQFLGIYGRTLDVDGLIMTRYFGSALFGLAVLNWLFRNQVTRAVLIADLAVSVTGVVFSFFDALSGSGNAVVWTTPAVYILLTLGFGYFFFVGQESPKLAVQG